MFTKLILPLAWLTLILSACGQQATPPPPTVDPLIVDSAPKPVDLQTDDDVAIKATYYPPANPQAKSPAILLVHMLDSNKEAWQGFATAAQELGYAVMAIDLRGHGQSEGSQLYDLMDNDVDAALVWLMSRPEITADRIGIAGASIGANLALRGGSRHEQIKAVVMLSPGLDYQGVTALDALARYGRRAVLIVAAERDAYAADSARTLNTQALGQHQLQIYPGSDHGTNIFQAQAGLQPMMLAWFASTL
jgi:dienelactone hydrolase